jgi:hypothetical protein
MLRKNEPPLKIGGAEFAANILLLLFPTLLLRFDGQHILFQADLDLLP